MTKVLIEERVKGGKMDDEAEWFRKAVERFWALTTEEKLQFGNI